MVRVIKRRLDRKNAQQATRIITNSRYTSANATAAYQRNIDVCYPGVDTGAFQPLPVPRERFVLSVGTLTPEKGFDFLIDALGTLPAEQRPPLVLISNRQNPEELNYLTLLAEQQGVKLECLHNVSEADLQTWYARAGCVAYAPVREPLGLVALESMAIGVPLVGVAEGGVTETIVDNETGVLAPRDPEIFGSAILRVLDNPEWAKQLGQTGRQYVLERWTWDRHIEQLETLLYDTSQHTAGEHL
jgi:glycosyltransferase involved in cell wall biosynthesis